MQPGGSGLPNSKLSLEAPLIPADENVRDGFAPSWGRRGKQPRRRMASCPTREANFSDGPGHDIPSHSLDESRIIKR